MKEQLNKHTEKQTDGRTDGQTIALKSNLFR
jgi:hypothetical protein